MKFFICLFIFLCFSHACFAASTEAVINVPSFELPRFSAHASPETRAGILKQEKIWAEAKKICNPWKEKDGPAIRACEAKMFPHIMTDVKKVFPAHIHPKVRAGVYTEEITPAQGQVKQDRVLINLHSGGFKYLSRFGGQLEGMPLAAIGQYRVVAVDYAKAPEHRFPAASKDAVAVYRELLKHYKPENIGIYGCSAGARVTGETIARIHAEGLPMVGAAAMLCSAPTRLAGDSNHYGHAIKGAAARSIADFDYWNGVSPDNAMAFPGESEDMLAIFPPSLLMTSTRDYALSPMVKMHSTLVKLDKTTELHIYEGFGHAGFWNIYVPESKQAARTISLFFDKYLGGKEK